MSPDLLTRTRIGPDRRGEQAISLPPPLMTSEAGSFARQTIVERKPQIIRQVVRDNRYAQDIEAALDAFRREIADDPVQPLTSSHNDATFWNQQLLAYRGRTWLELPWYLAETYFYRRMLEAVRYFDAGPWWQKDPFAQQKELEEKKALVWWSENSGRLAAAVPEEAFEALLHASLWGNRADLSNFSIAEEVRSGLADHHERQNLLIDHSDSLVALLSSGVKRVDFVNDNTGRELLLDLALAAFLLDQGWAREIVFHLKNQPFFVSDAMPKDVLAIVARLQGEELGPRLDGYLSSRRLLLRDHPFWTSCLMFREMPSSLRAELAAADLVIFKGDVNYRRLLDDRHWPHSTRLEDVTAYFPTPFAALRTLKGEIMVGLEPGQAEALSAQDPNWLINGKRGIIHVSLPVESAQVGRAIRSD